jgi:threonyl-tRNA synthetase
MLIVGDREAADGTVSVREHRAGDTGSLPLEEVIQLYSGALKPRTLSMRRA